MLVREVMTSDPVTVRKDATAHEAILLLATHEITSLPVVTEKGRICGVVSEADLVRERLATDPRTREIPDDDESVDRARYVDDVMTPHAITVQPEDDLAEAVDLITSTSIKSVPVVDARGRVLGILSRSDVVRLLAQPNRTVEAAVDAELTSLGMTDWLVEAQDGEVTLTGPDGSADGTVARLVASRVPGVLEVRLG